MGKPRDIYLPNETGELDPRLPRTPANVLAATKGKLKKILKPINK
jgi:hypothetical protein